MVSIKAVVTNNAALVAKYGPAGALSIENALRKLIAADSSRGLTTLIFDIADATEMTAVGGAAVIGPKDEQGAKLAVDAIYGTHKPDYIMLLDGPDVVPHIELDRIPGVADGDNKIDSDLPYASPAKFSRRARDFLAVTRVVGRLPAARGESDPNKLIGLIDASIAHVPRQPEEFKNYFAITADRWKASSQITLSAIFGGNSLLFVSPIDCHVGIDGSLASNVHFINCHGAPIDWRFYGDKAGSYPVAMETPGFAAPVVGTGAVVAAECCYGAQLYNYRQSAVHPPLCLIYLWKGACAVMGSTTISYGASASSGQADIIAQLFLQEVLKGASTGRAMLQARQSFVQTQTMAGFLNLKTVAQFLLLGDPSLQALEASGSDAVSGQLETAEPKSMQVKVTDRDSERKIRRIALASTGKAVASAATLPGRRTSVQSLAVERFTEVAREQGFQSSPKVFTVTGGSEFRKTAKAFERPRQVAIVMEETKCADNNGRELFTSHRALIGHIVGDGMFLIEDCESR